jgi:transcriptional regulator with XRE-family HTH domain
LNPPLAAWLTAADCSQARFARLTGLTPRQVNAWCRGHAHTPRWALLIAALLRHHSPDAMAIALEEALLRDDGSDGTPEQSTGPASSSPPTDRAKRAAPDRN